MAGMVRLVAPAKLTLSLRITGVRADGYHLIDAEMVSLDLCDELIVESFDLDARPGDGSLGGGSFGSASSSDCASSDGGDGTSRGGGLAGGDAGATPDLVWRALALAGRPARIRVTKRIPPGAGLGGGSSDAAAVLRWAGHDDALSAARLGADVPFCLAGGRARVGGIGEELAPLAHVSRAFTLLTPPFGCSTPAVYAAWDRLGGPVGERGNDLEPAALAVEPRLALYRDLLGDVTGRTPRLAGSGSTWFVPGAFPGGDRIVAHTVPARYAGPSRASGGPLVGDHEDDHDRGREGGSAGSEVAWPLPGSTATFELRSSDLPLDAIHL